MNGADCRQQFRKIHIFTKAADDDSTTVKATDDGHTCRKQKHGIMGFYEADYPEVVDPTAL
jgi:hypothetical protein